MGLLARLLDFLAGRKTKVGVRRAPAAAPTAPFAPPPTQPSPARPA